MPTLEFGMALGAGAAMAHELVRLAQRGDALGLDLLGLPDHSYAGTNLDNWTVREAVGRR
jgi:alkanesulfonate monooxygenase SsuD/methylene tetrahydromethanopterin reductase-like flavin-dependent oxidoreductase (luciferase family)